MARPRTSAQLITTNQTDLTDLLWGIELESHSVDVRRLRDEASPIQAGEEVMFVAASKFRVSGIDEKVKSQTSLGLGSELLTIRADAELVSEEEVDDISALRKHLDDEFAFHFLVNGVRVPEKDLRIDGDPPWVLRLDTSRHKDEHLNVDAEVVRRPKTPPAEEPDDTTDGSLELHFRAQGKHLVVRMQIDPTSISKNVIENLRSPQLFALNVPRLLDSTGGKEAQPKEGGKEAQAKEPSHKEPQPKEPSHKEASPTQDYLRLTLSLEEDTAPDSE